MESLVIDSYLKLKGKRKRFFLTVKKTINGFYEFWTVDQGVAKSLQLDVNDYRKKLQNNFNACYSKRKRLMIFLNKEQAELALEWVNSLLLIDKLIDNRSKVIKGRDRIPGVSGTFSLNRMIYGQI